MMFTVKIADLCIGIDNKYGYLPQMCRDYMSSGAPDFTVSASSSEIAAEDDGSGFDAGYLESLAVYRNIADRVLDYDGFLMHASVLDVDGRGVAFTARSGTGKTTHAAFWLKLLKGRCRVVNGDKPIIRRIDGVFYAYGTPWCGKELLNANTRVPLRDIGIINRSDENRAEPVKNPFPLLYPAVYKPQEKDKLRKTIELMCGLLENANVYSIFCNMSIDAARSAYNAIFGL